MCYSGKCKYEGYFGDCTAIKDALGRWPCHPEIDGTVGANDVPDNREVLLISQLKRSPKMNHAQKSWLDKNKDGKINMIENEFRQRFKLTKEEAHELVLQYIKELK